MCCTLTQKTQTERYRVTTDLIVLEEEVEMSTVDFCQNPDAATLPVQDARCMMGQTILGSQAIRVHILNLE